MRRGEIRWYEYAAPDKRRPVLLLTRDSVIDSLGKVIVAPLTTRIRAIPTEVVLTPDDDGMPAACAINLVTSLSHGVRGSVRSSPRFEWSAGLMSKPRFSLRVAFATSE